MEMTAHERMVNLFKGKEIDRLPRIEWCPFWRLTADRWVKEGLPCTIRKNGTHLTTSTHYELQEYFGLDKVASGIYKPYTKDWPYTEKGYTKQGLVANVADYHKVKKHLYPEFEVDKDHIALLKKMREAGDTVIPANFEGFFWFPRVLFDIEPHLYSFYDEPDLYKEICEDYVTWLKKVIECLTNEFQFDYYYFMDDMSYNHGPMIGKEQFDEFLAPYYKQITALLHSFDIPVLVDSDGDITKAVDWYASTGVDGMLPLERQAGVDVSVYLKKQPNMFFLGHFDKMCMKFGEEAMRAEFERLLPSIKTRRYIPSVDHQTPPDVSLENYKIYVKLLKEYTCKI